MAKLRQLAQMLLQDHLLRKRQAEGANLVSDRQTELAYLNDFLERSRSMDENALALDFEEQQSALGDPSGKIGLALQRSGKFAPPGSVRTQMELEQPALEQIGKAQTQSEIPDIQTLIAERASRGPIENLGSLTGTLQARNSRLGQIGQDQEMAMDRKFAEAEGTALSTGRGQETATAEAFPAELGRKKQLGEQENQQRIGLEKSLSPILTDRAGDSAFASTMGTQQAQAEFAETDPSIDGVAQQIMNNPELLDKLTPSDRFKMLKRMSILGIEAPTKTREATQHMVEDAEMALDEVLKNKAGMAGAFGVPSLTDPGSLNRINPFGDGTAAAGSAAGDTQAAVNTLVSALTLPRLELMKGFGHLSDADMAVLRSAATKLQGKLSDKAAQNELVLVRKILDTARERAGLPPRVNNENPVLTGAKSKLDAIRGGRGAY